MGLFKKIGAFVDDLLDPECPAEVVLAERVSLGIASDVELLCWWHERRDRPFTAEQVERLYADKPLCKADDIASAKRALACVAGTL